jgi:hypothetical protein
MLQSGTPDGADNEHPLKLEGVTAQEFRPFARAGSSRCVLTVEVQISCLLDADALQHLQLSSANAYSRMGTSAAS